MSITLSSADLENLARATELLVSPLDHSHVDGWRSAVNRHLRELLHADSAGFLLPVSAGLMMYSEEHDAEELSQYPEFAPPDLADGTSAWEQMIRSGVDTLANMYGRDYDRYLASAYYNEYAGANGAHDPLLAAISVGGLDARGMASLHLWHARPNGRLFGEREVMLLRLLFPAFRAGVESYLRWGKERERLLDTLDGLGQPALVSDLAGEILHMTPGMEAVLENDRDAAILRGELRARVHHACSSTRGGDAFARSLPESGSREVRTRDGCYRISCCLYGDAPGGSPLVLVGLERLPAEPPSAAELRARFGFTPRQAEVALLLVERLSNAEIAERLFISPHTALRHTEAVMSTLKIGDRRQIADRLRNPGGDEQEGAAGGRPTP